MQPSLNNIIEKQDEVGFQEYQINANKKRQLLCYEQTQNAVKVVAIQPSSAPLGVTATTTTATTTTTTTAAAVEEKQLPKRQRKNEAVCTICEKGGELLMCDGACLRSFHVECLGLQSLVTPGQRWECDDCLNQQNSCFSCKKRGIIGMDLMKCKVHQCGKFYHHSCIAEFPLAKMVNTKSPRFNCPLHYCGKCGQSGDGKQSVHCFRCPAAYHVTCIPPGVKMLTKSKETRKTGLILCPKHQHETVIPTKQIGTCFHHPPAQPPVQLPLQHQHMNMNINMNIHHHNHNNQVVGTSSVKSSPVKPEVSLATEFVSSSSSNNNQTLDYSNIKQLFYLMYEDNKMNMSNPMLNNINSPQTTPSYTSAPPSIPQSPASSPAYTYESIASAPPSPPSFDLRSDYHNHSHSNHNHGRYANTTKSYEPFYSAEITSAPSSYKRSSFGKHQSIVPSISTAPSPVLSRSNSSENLNDMNELTSYASSLIAIRESKQGFNNSQQQQTKYQKLNHGSSSSSSSSLSSLSSPSGQTSPSSSSSSSSSSSTYDETRLITQFMDFKKNVSQPTTPKSSTERDIPFVPSFSLGKSQPTF
ncbi:PHD zinc finger-containing protein [Cavenderia fasciculata]|uniref:PHD zinc finger-containing protein n=1 Tax=Cavenderia fasciculata TaxID=261658 RepID=F4QCF8_CACFS|nr:PHD zinc finger-containing protein [Cavenderia fasciculata]EGG13593.1 PHD zinc finger-containing protein [Cavenderia fasciculata]|eukprot:XP_004350297.1 PHD zinc finger-containing protein [Cavenderia fasciculata]